jgi:RNA polymerase sigma-70 factor (ECF subfamily)
MRNVALERSLEEEFVRSSARLEAWLAGSESSPSQRASREEELLRVGEALERLSPSQREAIELHHLEGLTVPEVAEHLQCSRAAVAGLLRRGLKNLREHLTSTSGIACPSRPTTGSGELTS